MTPSYVEGFQYTSKLVNQGFDLIMAMGMSTFNRLGS